MTLEHFILVAIAAISMTTVIYIPKNKYRLALVSFLTLQFVTWAGSIITVELGEYNFPVREFVRATRITFILFFIFYPMLFTWFILLYPHKSRLPMKAMHYFVFVSVIVWFFYFISVYTDLSNLRKSSLSGVIHLYIRVFIYFIGARIYISWFSKKTNLSTGVNNDVSH